MSSSGLCVVTKFNCSQQIFLGQRHVHLVLQRLVQDAGVGQGGCLGPLSGDSLPHLLPPAPPGVAGLLVVLHIFINRLSDSFTVFRGHVHQTGLKTYSNIGQHSLVTNTPVQSILSSAPKILLNKRGSKT